MFPFFQKLENGKSLKLLKKGQVIFTFLALFFAAARWTRTFNLVLMSQVFFTMLPLLS
jgi:hypothetical protein